MLLLITVLILFTYTLVLLMFFMGWCALLPKIAHPRPEVVPFSVVKSPRRNSMFINFENIPSMSVQSLDHLHQKLSITSGCTASSASHIASSEPSVEKTKRSTSTPNSSMTYSLEDEKCLQSNKLKKAGKSGNSLGSVLFKFTPQNDYLHPKYSLPPIKIDIADHVLANQHLLRTPVHIKCSPTKSRSKSFEDGQSNDEESLSLTYYPSSSSSSQPEPKRKLGIDKNSRTPKSLSPCLGDSALLETGEKINQFVLHNNLQSFIV